MKRIISGLLSGMAAGLFLTACTAGPEHTAAVRAPVETTITEVRVQTAQAAPAVQQAPVTVTQTRTVTQTVTPESCKDAILTALDIMKSMNRQSGQYLAVLKAVERDDYETATDLLKGINDSSKDDTARINGELADQIEGCFQ